MAEHQYNPPLYPPLMREFTWFYETCSDLTTVAYVRDAFKHIVMIRHKVSSRNMTCLQLGCLNCKRLSGALYYRSTRRYQLEAQEVFHAFFGPYRGSRQALQKHWSNVLSPPYVPRQTPASSADEEEQLPDDIADTSTEAAPSAPRTPPLPMSLLSTGPPLPPDPEGLATDEEESSEDSWMTDPASSSVTDVQSGSSGLVPLLPTGTDPAWDPDWCWWQRMRNQVSVQRR